MTWLSDRSGIASMGVAASAHQPQPARPRYNATTMKRFFSDSSMSRLIISHYTRHAVPRRAAIPPGPAPGRTHDGCEWLKRGKRTAERALEREPAVRAFPKAR